MPPIAIWFEVRVHLDVGEPFDILSARTRQGCIPAGAWPTYSDADAGTAPWRGHRRIYRVVRSAHQGPRGRRALGHHYELDGRLLGSDRTAARAARAEARRRGRPGRLVRVVRYAALPRHQRTEPILRTTDGLVYVWR